MKKIVLYLFIPACCMSCNEPAAEQNQSQQTETEINDSVVVEEIIMLDTLHGDAYISEIDSLVAQGKLERKHFHEKSQCGGDLNGYYYEDDLVYLIGYNEGEHGYNERRCYFKDSVLYFITETLFHPIRNGVPNPQVSSSMDESEIEFSFEVRTIRIFEDGEMIVIRDGKEVFYYPESHDAFIQRNKDCAEEMRSQLTEQK